MRESPRRVSHQKIKKAFESHNRYFEPYKAGLAPNCSNGRSFNRRKVNYDGFDFTGIAAKYANFIDSVFINNRFLNTSLTTCSFRGCDFNTINFDKTSFQDTKFVLCHFFECDFSQTDLLQASFFSGCTFENCRFGISLRNIKRWGCKYEPEMLPWLILNKDFCDKVKYAT